jgi:hypothetical protein
MQALQAGTQDADQIHIHIAWLLAMQLFSF